MAEPSTSPVVDPAEVPVHDAPVIVEKQGLEVKDLGWHEHVDDVPQPLVGGLPNEELWTLVRRFNKQMYHVKAIQEAPPGGLDLNIADEEEFSSDKLRSNVERLYMTVVVGFAAFAKHMARLSSWGEKWRTGFFCVCYFTAWFFDMLVPGFLTLIIVLMVHPPARTILFPPAPLALVDASTGSIKSPPAGVLGSKDSLTGAPEKYQGEAVEQEASNFVSSFAAIGVSSAIGKHPDTAKVNGEEDKTKLEAIPDPTAIATKGSEAQGKAQGSQEHHDKTKKPVEEAMWEKLRPIMHIIGDICDTWERFANALSPTPPFPRNRARLKLAGLVVPLLLASLFVTGEMVVKGTNLLIGIVFFTQPVANRTVDWLNKNIPDWKKYLEIRITVLNGVPTNAQLAITLLRIGEANKAPLPPPPRSDDAPKEEAVEQLDADDIPLDVTHEEVADAINPSTTAATPNQPPPKKKAGSRVLGFFRQIAKGGVSTTLGADRVKATAGSHHAKNRLGILPKSLHAPIGPVDFHCRYNGKRGVAYLTSSTTPPTLSFAYEKATKAVKSMLDVAEQQEKVAAEWTIDVTQIQELKKVGGLGWKGKLLVGWAMEREVADGLEIVMRDGEKRMVTAVQLREELFNRLVAMGGQMWESW